MSVQTVLVIGATGTVGGPVAQQLLAGGYHMRLLVCDVERIKRPHNKTVILPWKNKRGEPWINKPSW